MVIGVTMVKVVPGQEKAVYNALQEIEGITHEQIPVRAMFSHN